MTMGRSAAHIKCTGEQPQIEMRQENNLGGHFGFWGWVIVEKDEERRREGRGRKHEERNRRLCSTKLGGKERWLAWERTGTEGEIATRRNYATRIADRGRVILNQMDFLAESLEYLDCIAS